MSKYKRILLALDLKPEDDEPVSDQAMTLARAEGSEVSLVHVVEPIYSYGIPPGTEGKFDEWEKELEHSAKEQLGKIGRKLSIPPERQYLAVGQLKKQLLSTADLINADLIVVGSHARHGLKALFMGDTADDMLHNAKCDVLAVNISRKR